MDDPPAAVDLNERAELERLRAENAQLRMDREFLKSSGLLRGGERVEPDTAFTVIHGEGQHGTVGAVGGADVCAARGVPLGLPYDWVARQATGPGPRARLLELAGKVTAAGGSDV